MFITARAVRISVAATALGAILLSATLIATTDWAKVSLWMVAFLLAAGLAANWFPLHLADKTKVFVDTAVFTAAVLVLPPGPAVAVAAGAVLIHGLVTRKHWEQALFNPAQTALYVGAGAGAFRVVAAAGRSAGAPTAGIVAGALAGVTVMHAVNTALVAGIVALQLDRRPMHEWLDGLAIDLPEHTALTVTGVLAAGLLVRVPWLAPLLAAPIAVVYVSLRTTLELRAASSDLAAAAARVAHLLEGAEPKRSPGSAASSPHVDIGRNALAER
jgi:hypothetical protein